LRRDLHPETPQVGKAFYALVGDLRVAFDDAAVDGVEEFPQLGLRTSRFEQPLRERASETGE